ncbi:MAG: biopolymer transporter ExbD [Candidatus Aminicenantes bacterium]|nr:biopolymer transporter ExbD [Candidatus Aminicenantes bacterium]
MGSGETGSDSAKSEPNVVPLCDILLVLLIIFMVITPMVQKGANVKLPETMNYQEQPEPGNMTEVALKLDGTIYLDNKPIDIAELVGKIQAILEDSPDAESKVLLKADINLEYGKVVDIMNLIKNAEIEVIGLVTEQGTSDI